MRNIKQGFFWILLILFFLILFFALFFNIKAGRLVYPLSFSTNGKIEVINQNEMALFSPENLYLVNYGEVNIIYGKIKKVEEDVIFLIGDNKKTPVKIKIADGAKFFKTESTLDNSAISSFEEIGKEEFLSTATTIVVANLSFSSDADYQSSAFAISSLPFLLWTQ